MKIRDRAQPKEVSIFHSFWEPIGASGLQTRANGRPHKDRSDFKLGSVAKCETIARYSGAYGILQKFYQRLCQDHRADGKVIEEGCLILLERGLQENLGYIERNMVTLLILVFPDWKKEFHVHVDVSCIALGAALTQDSGEGLHHPIVFTSCRLSKAEKSYSTTECD